VVLAAALALVSCGSSTGAPAPAASPPQCLVSWPGSGLIDPDFVLYQGIMAQEDCLRQVRDHDWRYVDSYSTAHILCQGRLPNGDAWAVAGQDMTAMAQQLCRGQGL
jgi:hypothetical protein